MDNQSTLLPSSTMSNLSTVEHKKKKAKKKITVWQCDVCKDKSFADYNQCLEHEQSCAGPPLAPLAPASAPTAVRSATAPVAVRSAPAVAVQHKQFKHKHDTKVEKPPPPVHHNVTKHKTLRHPHAKEPPVKHHRYRKQQLTKGKPSVTLPVSSVQCSGRAAEALEVFRKRQAELEREDKRKPDMIAFKELRHRYTCKRHGEIPGVPVGLLLYGRGEAAILGIHTQILAGIDALKDDPCYAICISGGYKDDVDNDPDGTIVYTGAGGQDKKRRQIRDQEENAENGSLMLSYIRKVPVRVLRGRKVNGKPVYIYEGLYTCVDYDYVPSKDGPKVYKFKLKPIDPEKKRSFEVDFHTSHGGNTQKAGTSRSRLQDKVAARLSGKKRQRP